VRRPPLRSSFVILAAIFVFTRLVAAVRLILIVLVRALAALAVLTGAPASMVKPPPPDCR
jgi:hypothetical protein